MKILNQYQQEFIEILLKKETFYPWNPDSPETEEYFAQQQENCSFAESLNTDELLSIDNRLFTQLHIPLNER